MAQTPTRVIAGALTTTLTTTLYTVPVGKTLILKQITLQNNAVTATTATIVLAGVALANLLSLPPNSTTLLDLSQVLNSGETITGGASVGATVSILASGVVSP